MSDGKISARIILKENLEFSGGVLDGDVTEFTGLKSLRRPAMNGTGFYTERMELVYADGSVEKVDGHYLGSEVNDDD